MAMPIWAKFFQRAFADEAIGLDAEGTFFEPTEEIDIVLDCEEYNQPSGDPDHPFDHDGEYENGMPTETIEDLESEFD